MTGNTFMSYESNQQLAKLCVLCKTDQTRYKLLVINTYRNRISAESHNGVGCKGVLLQKPDELHSGLQGCMPMFLADSKVPHPFHQ